MEMPNDEKTVVDNPSGPRRSTRYWEDPNGWCYEIIDPKAGASVIQSGFKTKAKAQAAAKKVKTGT